jgi:hypothetical protein
MRLLLGILVCCGLVACGSEEPPARAELGDPVALSADVRLLWESPHRVFAEHRTADGWSDPEVVLDEGSRECGKVRSVGTGSVVAATLLCDEHYAEDQAPTASVALLYDGSEWHHHDLRGEAYLTPGLSPDGSHAVWVQDDELLTWADGDFGTRVLPDEPTQVVTVEDDGGLVLVSPGHAEGRCTVELTTEGARATVPVADADLLLCDEVGLSLESPTELQGDVSGQPGTDFVVRRQGGTWTLAAPPPVTAPGLEVYPDDPSRAVWNQVTENTGGDLVAVGSPDRQHVTAQRYDPSRQRWTRPEVVHDAGAPVCRRDDLDSGIVQGASFELRLFCDGKPVVLRSRTGESWTS